MLIGQRHSGLIPVIFLAMGMSWSTLSTNVQGQVRELIETFSEDQKSLKFRYQVPMSTTRGERLHEFYSNWQTRVNGLDFSALDLDQKIDAIMLRNYVRFQLQELARESSEDQKVKRLIPFWKPLVRLLQQHEDLSPVDGKSIATTYHELSQQVSQYDSTVLKNTAKEDPSSVFRTIRRLESLRRKLDEMNRFRDGYDPTYTWWTKEPYEALNSELRALVRTLERQVQGEAKSVSDRILGQPIGRSALRTALKNSMISYTPQELIGIANREMEWCDAEMAKAAKALGYKDWRAAQEFVKTRHVEPGDQPAMIAGLAKEAIQFLEGHNLITIPEIAKESWRMKMMSPARQKMSPYFLGGKTIIVSFPTDTMSHADKLMSMRGNNIHFSRATVHHELIPGHHLQFFMNDRHKSYRKLFTTPFWLEGWAVYWEMLLWDMDFARSAEDRIGMLFWRKHRCARIIFSLSYHIGEMDPDECIELLIERVGHERNNATAEVRRSIMGGYGPLYQAAYMIGALQFRRLHEELVQSRKMTNREFHDAIMKENYIPVELLRAKLTKQPLSMDYEPQWRFYD